ncbi:hypothetical protein KL86DPRO_20028 [uncultured delta proteobacterium]|uniref:Uncharacterized protein n=1 Tax=uncultured delta proteobacterium TaxID=34034 RepID=A0A212JTI7_9DELT|nr:hypothetical protein KL86DPRO_20028 [uncultured delta proteobacterium]
MKKILLPVKQNVIPAKAGIQAAQDLCNHTLWQSQKLRCARPAALKCSDWRTGKFLISSRRIRKASPRRPAAA